jgi:hypothetical protein
MTALLHEKGTEMSGSEKTEPSYSQDTLLETFQRPNDQEMRVFHCKLEASNFFKFQNWQTKGPRPAPILTAGVTIRTYEVERVLAALAYKPGVAASQDTSLTTITDEDPPSCDPDER